MFLIKLEANKMKIGWLSKILSLLTLSFVILINSSCVSIIQAEPARYISNQQNMNHLMNSVVAIIIEDQAGVPMIGCTGFFVSPRQIVTAQHCELRRRITLNPNPVTVFVMETSVIEVGTGVNYISYQDWRAWENTPVASRNTLRTHRANIIAQNLENDVVILGSYTPSNHWLRINNSIPNPGERTYTLSQPGLLRWMISEGVVAQTQISDNRTFISTTNSIYMGSSGCPLINNSGEVIGIADAIAYRQSTFGLFTPISVIRNLIH